MKNLIITLFLLLPFISYSQLYGEEDIFETQDTVATTYHKLGDNLFRFNRPTVKICIYDTSFKELHIDKYVDDTYVKIINNTLGVASAGRNTKYSIKINIGRAFDVKEVITSISEGLGCKSMTIE